MRFVENESVPQGEGKTAAPACGGPSRKGEAKETERAKRRCTSGRTTLRARRSTLEGRPQLVLVLEAEAKDLQFGEKDGRHTTDLLFVTCHKAADGRIVGGTSNLLTLRLPEEKYRQVEANGLRVTVSTEPESEATLIRLILLDGATGRAGSVDLPLAEVLAPAAATTAPGEPHTTPASPPGEARALIPPVAAIAKQ